VLGAHQHSINDAKDAQKYFNKVSGLAEAVLVEFKKQFGEENGPTIANLVWMHYPFAIASSDQAAELTSLMKPGSTPEETMDLNIDTLSKCSICNLIPLKSLLSTPGMNAGFLHRTEMIQIENGLKTVNLFMTLPDAQHLLKDVDVLIRFGGKVQPVEREKSRASSSSPVIEEEKATSVALDTSSEAPREAKKIHGKHSKKVVKQQQSQEDVVKQNGLT
jgi:hypothetical protein